MLEILSGLATPANLIIGLIALIVAILVAYYQIIPARDQIRRDFLLCQPDVRIRSASIISSEPSYTARFRLHNLARTTAYDVTVVMDGWPGEEHVSFISPLRPGHNEYEIPIELSSDSPIRTTLLEGARLRIRYRDRWHNWYETSYLVVQTSRANGLFNVHIEVEHPTVRRPPVSLRKMRRHLREIRSPYQVK